MRTRLVDEVRREEAGTGKHEESYEIKRTSSHLLLSGRAEPRPRSGDHLFDRGWGSRSPQVYCHGGKDLIQTS
jgi:hypothetical protein